MSAIKKQKISKIVLVTGGSGLVGKGIKAVVSENPKDDEEWYFAGSKDADLENLEQTRALFDRIKPTHVVHLAAFVGGLFRNLKYPVDFFEKNTAMNNNVLKVAMESKVTKLTSCLSTCVFPDAVTYPLQPSALHDGPPHTSNEAYAYAKRNLEMLSRMYRKQYGCNYTTFIPTNVYGPYDNFNLEDSHVIPGLIHKFYNAKKNGTDMTIFGTGKPLRQFIYSEDLARLIIWSLWNYDDETPLICSVDESQEVSIKYVAETIKEAMAFEGELKFDTSKSDGQYKKTASNTQLQELNPGFTFVPFKEGIAKATKWFVENYDTCRK